MIFLIIIAAFIGLGILQTVRKAQFKSALKASYDRLSNIIPNFRPDKVYRNPDGLCMIEMDVKMQKIHFAHKLPEAKLSLFDGIPSHLISSRSINFKDILKVEMIVDGQMVSSKSAGGALAGGLLFGTTGAVIGSNTGKTKYSKEVKSVSLKLIINAPLDPVFEMLFYMKGISTTLPLQAQKDCQNWVDTLFVAASQPVNA